MAPEIAHSIDDVDRVMRWGFGWELGPFETLDAIGVREVVEAAAAAGIDRRAAAHRRGPGRRTQPAARRRRRPRVPACSSSPRPCARSQVVKKNAGASLVDLGDGVLAVQFHSKMNAIGGDTIADAACRRERSRRRTTGRWSSATKRRNFSAGANLMLVLLEAQEGNWDELDLMVRAFQRAVMALRYSPVPVVVAPAGLALGGGCEVALHADRVHAAGDTFMGLVEVGVGLIPAGGGTKEMVVRAMSRLPSPGADPLPFVQQAFETVALAKVSASAPDAVATRLSVAARHLLDEPRAAHGRREGPGAPTRGRGLPSPAAAPGDSGRR